MHCSSLVSNSTSKRRRCTPDYAALHYTDAPTDYLVWIAEIKRMVMPSFRDWFPDEAAQSHFAKSQFGSPSVQKGWYGFIAVGIWFSVFHFQPQDLEYSSHLPKAEHYEVRNTPSIAKLLVYSVPMPFFLNFYPGESTGKETTIWCSISCRRIGRGFLELARRIDRGFSCRRETPSFISSAGVRYPGDGGQRAARLLHVQS